MSGLRSAVKLMKLSANATLAPERSRREVIRGHQVNGGFRRLPARSHELCWNLHQGQGTGLSVSARASSRSLPLSFDSSIFLPSRQIVAQQKCRYPSTQQSKHVDVHVAFSSESLIYCNGADRADTSNIRVPHTIPIPTTDKPGCPHVSKCKGECRRNSPECPELSSPRCLEECDARLKFVTASPLTPLRMLSTYSAILGTCSRGEVALKDDRLEILFVRLYTIS